MSIPAELDGDLDGRDVRFAESLLEKTRGFMFRHDVSDEALVFEFGDVDVRRMHMLFVPVPLRVVWCRGGEVVKDEILRPWTGYGAASGDTVIELTVPSDNSRD